MDDSIVIETRGKKSSDFDIVVTKVNNLSSPTKKLEVYNVQGRNGSLVIDTGSYEDFNLICECSIVSEKNIMDICRDIKQWLKSDVKYKPITISNDSNKCYEGYCANAIDIEPLVERFNEFILIFTCKPFKRIKTNNVTITSKGTVIKNSGTVNSEPSIKITGTGDITLKINSQEVTLKDVQNNIYIDSEAMNAYRIDPVSNLVTNENSKMYSDFPILETGDNTINWTGNITKIEIEPRFSEL